ncbi:hypothetical protein ACOWO3_06870 [Helicobacter pylori]
MKTTEIKPSDITLSEDQKTPIKEQVFRLKELTLGKINAICKEKITKGFKSNYKTLYTAIRILASKWN